MKTITRKYFLSSNVFWCIDTYYMSIFFELEREFFKIQEKMSGSHLCHNSQYPSPPPIYFWVVTNIKSPPPGTVSVCPTSRKPCMYVWGAHSCRAKPSATHKTLLPIYLCSYFHHVDLFLNLQNKLFKLTISKDVRKMWFSSPDPSVLVGSGLNIKV